jgi:hypothetical protein
MATDEDQCRIKMKRLLEILIKLKRVEDSDADVILASFNDFLRSVVAGQEMSSRFKEFQHQVVDHRVDTLLYETMGQNKRFEKLWKVVRQLLLVSHGQASVERGFSLNRQIEKDNMSEGMHVALRHIIDHLILVDGMFNVDITKELLASASGARHRYSQFLDEQRKQKGREAIQAKRKHAEDEVNELKKRRKVLLVDIESLTKLSEKYADEAESKAGATSHSLLVKSNAMRHAAKEKKEEP